MRNISFMLTTDAVRKQTKTVTRRLGWRGLRAGTQLCGCVKCQGLKPGEALQRLCVIEVIAVNREPLHAMLTKYGPEEAAREGFPNMTNSEFVAMYTRHMKCDSFTVVTRIEFKYVEASHHGERTERRGETSTGKAQRRGRQDDRARRAARENREDPQASRK